MQTINLKIIDYARKREVKNSIKKLNREYLNPEGVHIDADVEHRSSVVPTMKYKGKSKEGKGRYHVADTWLREHVTEEHLQYDGICFSFEDQEWYSLVGKDQNGVGGTEFGEVDGVPTMAMTATRGQKNNLSGEEVSEWLRRFLHELSHMVCGITGQRDMTHYYDYDKNDLAAIIPTWQLDKLDTGKKKATEKPQKPRGEEQRPYTAETLGKLERGLESLSTLIPRLSNVFRPSSRKRFLAEARKAIGEDVSPKEDELGCAESVNTIATRALGSPVGGDVSTYRMYKALQGSKRFTEVNTPKPGDIIISPTGYGNREAVSNGHVGIVGANGVMSNDSRTYTWDLNFTLDSWKQYYGEKGGYPVKFFRAT